MRLTQRLGFLPSYVCTHARGYRNAIASAAMPMTAAIQKPNNQPGISRQTWLLKLCAEFRTHPRQSLLHPLIEVREVQPVPLSELVPVSEVHGVQPVHQESGIQ